MGFREGTDDARNSGDNGTQNYQDPQGNWHFGRKATGVGGYSNVEAPSYGAYRPPSGANGDDVTLGRVRGGDGGVGYGGGAWGGYVGEMRDDGRGGAFFDPSRSGRAVHVGQVRGLGQAAAEREAYRINYDEANRYSALSNESLNNQTLAQNNMFAVANGGPTAAQGLLARTQEQGLAAQRAAAYSTRGGALAQAAARQSQLSGEGAYHQQALAQQEALRADEMASARGELGGLLHQKRQQNQALQGMYQSQVERQADMENWQRAQNQSAQMGYEQMGQDINLAASRGALSAHEMQVGIDGAASARNQRNKDREARQIGAAVSAVGSLGAAAGGAFSGDETKPKSSGYDPYSEAVSASDARTKTNAKRVGMAEISARIGVRR